MSHICMIVESPHKCGTIQKYVGRDYQVVACYGHFRCIESLGDISQDDYTVKFTDIKSKSSVIRNLKKSISESSAVIIATDDDREGESIGWHICDRFGLSIQTTRIVFNEITNEAISHALKTPTIINMDIVNSQKTRQIIDMLVGYKVSPKLWKYIGVQKISAGRCQSPTLKLIYENHKKSLDHGESFRYVTSGYFTGKNIPFVLNKEYGTKDDMETFLYESKSYKHNLSRERVDTVSKEPPEPFNTLSLQQTANTDLKLTTKETMNACQLLYERGYITYMRTDSVKFSKEFIKTCNEFIIRSYGSEYSMVHKDMVADDGSAHEAIRPTKIMLEHPEDVTKSASRIYSLIRNRSIISCMTPMIMSILRCNIDAPMGASYRYISSRVDFQGWNIVSKMKKTDELFDYLKTISTGNIDYNKITCLQLAKDVARHYSESSLLRIMKTMGIGRPSTYSSIIETLKERKYVKYMNVKGTEYKTNDMEMIDGKITVVQKDKVYGAEKNKLVIQVLGVEVIEFLDTHYDALFNYTYSKDMEDQLDKIVTNDISSYDVCNDCNNTITQCSKTITSKNDGYKLDERHTYINGKYGPVIKCIENDKVTFKPVIEDVDIEKLEKGVYTPSDLIKIKEEDVIIGELDGDQIFIKSGKYGNYILHKSKTYSIPKDGIIDIEIATKIIHGIRELSPTISVRTGPKGPYIMIKSKGKKKPTFISLSGFKHDPYKCDISILMDMIG